MRTGVVLFLIILSLIGNFCFAGKNLTSVCQATLTINQAGRPSPEIEDFLKSNPRLVDNFIKDVVTNRLLFEGRAFKTAFKDTLSAHNLIGKEVEKSDELLIALSKGSSEVLYQFSSEMLNRVLVTYELKSDSQPLLVNDLKSELGMAISDSERLKKVDQTPEDYNKTKSLLKEVLETPHGEEFLTQAILFSIPTYVDEYRTWDTTNTGRGFLMLTSTVVGLFGGMISGVSMAANHDLGLGGALLLALAGAGSGVSVPLSLGALISDAKMSNKAKLLETAIRDYYKWNPIAVIPNNSTSTLGLVLTDTSSTEAPGQVTMAPLPLPVHVRDQETVPDAIQRASIREINTTVEQIKNVSDLMQIGIQIDGAISVLSRDLLTDKIIQAQGVSKLIPLISRTLEKGGKTDSEALQQIAEFRQVDLFEILKNLERFHSDSNELLLKIDTLIENLVENLDTYNVKRKVYSELVSQAVANKIKYLKQSRDLLKEIITIEGKFHQLVLKEEDNIMRINQHALRQKMIGPAASPETESSAALYAELHGTTQSWMKLLNSLNDSQISALFKPEWKSETELK